MYTDCGGFLETLPTVATIVEKGQVLARMRNIFGDIIREYHAPHDGVIIGRSVNPVSQTGARIVHLGEIGSEE
jgi:predicted deacylase